MTTLGRYTGIVTDNPALDVPLNRLPGVPRSTFHLESVDPRVCSSDLAAITSDTAIGVRIHVCRGDVLSSVTFVSGGTAGSGLTHQTAGIYSPDGTRVAVSADATTAAWAADTAKVFAMTTAVVVEVEGDYLFALTIAASTVPTLTGTAPRVGVAGIVAGVSLAPAVTFGSSLAGVLPATLPALTAVAKLPVAVVR